MHSYLTQFSLEQGLADGERLALVFHGVESALQLWVNGEEIGQAFDSFTPSEFDVSHAVRTGTNMVAVRVHRAATWVQVTSVVEPTIAHRSSSLHNGLRCSSLLPLK